MVDSPLFYQELETIQKQLAVLEEDCSTAEVNSPVFLQ